MTWWAMFLCLSGTYDYTDQIAMTVGGHYCTEITDSHTGAGVVLAVESRKTLPPSFSFEDIMGWNPDPWMNFYVVTVKSRADADPGAACGETIRYWIACYDRWMEYDSGRTECIHDCSVLALYRDGE